MTSQPLVEDKGLPICPGLGAHSLTVGWTGVVAAVPAICMRREDAAMSVADGAREALSGVRAQPFSKGGQRLKFASGSSPCSC